MKKLTMRETTAWGPINPDGEYGSLYRWDVLIYDHSKYSPDNVPYNAMQQFGVDMAFMLPPEDMQPYRNQAASILSVPVGHLSHAAPPCYDSYRQTVVTGSYE